VERSQIAATQAPSIQLSFTSCKVSQTALALNIRATTPALEDWALKEMANGTDVCGKASTKLKTLFVNAMVDT
jgi:hypothetical protein